MGKNDNNNNNNNNNNYIPPKELKMVLGGGPGVGKSAILIRYMRDMFLDEYDPTIEDSYRKMTMIKGQEHLMDILDTAGEEFYSDMSEYYVRPSTFFFLVFSLNNRKSFDDEIEWRLEKIRKIKQEKPCFIMLVGNKIDLKQEREVPYEVAKEFADIEGIPYKETSALSGEGIEEIFQDMVIYAQEGTYRQHRVVTIKKAE